MANTHLIGPLVRRFLLEEVGRDRNLSVNTQRSYRDALRLLFHFLAEYLSLSRLNHWLPRSQAHPEIVQGTAEFHHQITDAFFPQTDAVFHDATALHTTVDMLDPQPPLVERLVGPLLLQGQLRTAWLLRRHEDRHRRERERQEAQILQ